MHLVLESTGLILAAILVIKTSFLLRSDHAPGVVLYNKEVTYKGNGGTYIYPMVNFVYGDYSVTFRGEANIKYEVGDEVNVVFLKSDITEARVYRFFDFWIIGSMYGIFALLFYSAGVYAFFDPKDVVVLNRQNLISIERFKPEKIQ